MLVDRTIQLKNLARAIKEREFGIPDLTINQVQLLVRHIKALAPFKELDDDSKEVVETIKSSGDDHLSHALGSAILGFEKLSKTSPLTFNFV